jgi:hypothetical protein
MSRSILKRISARATARRIVRYLFTALSIVFVQPAWAGQLRLW